MVKQRHTAAPTRAALNADEMTVPAMPLLRFEGGTSSNTTAINITTHIESVHGRKIMARIAQERARGMVEGKGRDGWGQGEKATEREAR